MNEPEIKSPVPANDIVVQVAELQRQMFILLLVLLVVSASLAAYLRYEDYIAHKDADLIRPQASQIMGMFAQETAGINRQAVSNFVAQIGAYAPRNPDFAKQVLKVQPPAAPAAPVRK